jgi:SAM-dependent methyltransferase
MYNFINLEVLRGLCGLEIAGPSGIFDKDHLLPVYSYVGSLDDFSFPRPEDWGGRSLIAGAPFYYAPGHPCGRQFIGDATMLSGITSGSYQVILGSHVLEHIANPIKALRSWLDALTPNGLLLQVIPHGETTFDRNRPITTLEHLIDDFRRDVAEDDTEHYSEVRALSAQDYSEHWFSQAHLHRGIHHHVFNTASAVALFKYMGLSVIGLAAVQPHHIMILGRKGPLDGEEPLSKADIANILAHSPFKTDREAAREAADFK